MDSAVINIKDGVNGYVDLVKHVLEHGRETAPRGQKTREIEDAVVRIADPTNALPLNVGRGTVPGIGAVEAMQLLAGVSTPRLLLEIAPQFSAYTNDDGITFHGAYGARTDGQFAVVVERLKADPDSRQAQVVVWDPKLDLLPGKKDYPCTTLMQFRIRDGKLNMSVYMRSNDVWLGAAYDFFQFTRVQIALASVLGVGVGSYVHHVGSLHIYEQHYEAADKLKYTDNYVDVPAITGRDWLDVSVQALATLQAVREKPLAEKLSPEARWYRDAMAKAVEKNAGKQ